jgi:hypothetical protein
MLLTAAGLGSLLLLPIERLLPGTSLSALELRIAILIQPALLAGLALWAGRRFGPPLGLGIPLLDALASRQPARDLLMRRLPAILVATTATALLLIVYARWSGPLLAGRANVLASIGTPLLTRLLYGGILEEVLVRWGLMSAIAALLLRRRLAAPAIKPAAVMPVAIALAAMAFALGHLPLLVASGSATPVLVAAVIAGNSAAGLVFGWLFWRHGLESAMLAHAGAHAIAYLA